MSIGHAQSSRQIMSLGLLACLIILGCGGCKKEPTPKENSNTPSQFTEEKFQAVTVGQDWNSVVASIGQPYGTMDAGKGRKRYVYSKPKDPQKRYAAYDVVVGPEGKVIDKSVIYLVEE